MSGSPNRADSYTKMFVQGSEKSRKAEKVCTAILRRFVPPPEISPMWSNKVCRTLKVAARKRWMCMLQISTPRKTVEWKEFHDVFEHVNYSVIRSLATPIAIAHNEDYTYVEILEEFAGQSFTEAMKDKGVTQAQKDRMFARVLLEGACMLAMIDGRLYHSNICVNGLLMKYNNIRFAFSCLGKLTASDRTIPKGVTLNIIDDVSTAPEVLASLDPDGTVNREGLSAEKADINSLGMCLVQLIGNYSLVKGNQIKAYRRSNYPQFLKEVDKLKTQMSPKLHSILMRMLEMYPGKRVSAADLFKELSEMKEIQELHTDSTTEEAKEAAVRVGMQPAAMTQVLRKARVVESNARVNYVRSDKNGSMFFIDTVSMQYVMLKMYVENAGEYDNYLQLFELGKTLAKETNIVTNPIAIDYNEKDGVVEWLEEYGGVTIENIRYTQKLKDVSGCRFSIYDILTFFRTVLSLLRSIRNSLFLARVSRSSLLFCDKQARWCNLRYAYIIADEDGQVPEGAVLASYYKLTAAPEVIRSVDEASSRVSARFLATPADVYSLAMVIVSLLCDMDAQSQIQLIEARCKSTDCFTELFKKYGVPRELSDLLLKHCLCPEPEKRSPPEEILKILETGVDWNSTYKPADASPSRTVRHDIVYEEGKSILVDSDIAFPEPRKYIFSRTRILDKYANVVEEKWRQGGQGLIIRVAAADADGRQELLALKTMQVDTDQAAQQEKIWKAVSDVRFCVKVFAVEHNPQEGVFEVLMEFCDRTLSDLKDDYIKAGADSAPVEVVLKLFRQCVDAMACIQDMSAKGVHFYHGDLNPKNILLKNGEVRIADFGCAKVMGESTVVRGTEIEGYTPLYAAPEILRKELDAAITKPTYVKGDVFSLGICFLEFARLWKFPDMEACLKLRKEKGSTLMEEVEKIPEKGPGSRLVKGMLGKMLDPNYETRIDFKGLQAALFE